MAVQITMADKQYLAKILFTREQLDQKVVAKKVGVSENTISKWVNEFGWKNLRKRMLLTKEEQLNFLYEELEEISNKIKTKKEGERFADTKLADIRIKTTAAIKNLETDLNIADLVEAGVRFVKHLQRVGTVEQVMEVADLWYSFIQANTKR